MKKLSNLLFKLAIILFCIILVKFIFTMGQTSINAKKFYEEGYFTGQKQYKEGIIKIKENPNGSLSWSESCWELEQIEYSPNSN